MSSSQSLRFRADVACNVAYEDRSTFGSPYGQGPDLAVRHAFAPLLERLADSADALTALKDPAVLLGALAEHPTFAAMTTPHPEGWRIRPEVLHPDPALNRPRLLTIARPDTAHVVRAKLPDDLWGDSHDLVSALMTAALEPAARAALRPELSQLVDLMETEQLLEAAERAPEPERGGATGPVVFLGHNTVLVRSATTSLMVDPLLFARSTANPASYQPLQLRELGVPDVVAITHGHRDHFDPASLLRFPRSTTVIVPWIERESLLSADLALRARELGFSDVRALRWGERCTVGDLRITAYPFYGEQPTDGTWLHPDIRNQGCTYRVDTPELSAVFLADSGVDHLGDVRNLALRARREDGPVDVVFSGYRGWLTYPSQLLFSSVARYFLFVPPELWGCRMSLMSTADMALDTAERWGAKALCAYADGGAPWHWRLGLGPQLDDPTTESASFDPFPERVLEAAAARSSSGGAARISSPVDVVVLRPGEGLNPASDTGELQVTRDDRHRWPYEPQPYLAARGA